jgi:hypothetical protein
MAYLSGDLSAAAHARVEGHLALCWPCNQRYLALRGKMQQLRDALDKESILGPEQVARARQKFLARYAEWESGIEAERTPAFASLGRGWNIVSAMPLAIAAAIVCAAGLAAWLLYRAPQVQPNEVLAQTLQQEDNLRRREGPVHQQFEIDIRQVRPAAQQRSGVLSVWYDARGERFAGRWERDGGQLQYAIWRPERDREFVFNAALGATAVARAPQAGQSITLGELSFENASLEQLENGFLEWLANRRWEPISIASDVNLFRLRDGVEMQVELVESDRGPSSYRITARRPAAWGVVELVAEVDAGTYRPNIELLRLVTAERVFELRLRARHSQWPETGILEKAVFWPSVRIQGEGQAISELRPPARRPEPSADAASPAPRVEELDLLEIRARYALHQAGACLGEPVRVERAEGRLVRVEALAESSGRKNELLARLADLSASPFVRIENNTVEEALQRAAGGAPAGPRDGSPARDNGHPRTGERLEVIATDSPIRPALERYLRQASSPPAAQDRSHHMADLQELASQFSRRVISASLANLTEAWALRRLAERYGSAGESRLPAEASDLLRRMLREHVSGMIVRTGGIQKQVQPLLATLVADGGANPPPSAGAEDARPVSGAEHWAARSLRIFEEVESAEAATNALFADSGYANGTRREASPERAAAALLQALPRLESRLRSLERSLSAQDGKPPGAGRPTESQPAPDLP